MSYKKFKIDIALQEYRDEESAGEAETKVRSITFSTPYELNSYGEEILIFKEVLGVAVNKEVYNPETRGYFGTRRSFDENEAAVAGGVMNSDSGYNFSIRMQTALESYQISNRDKIVDYGRKFLEWPGVDGDITSPIEDAIGGMGYNELENHAMQTLRKIGKITQDGPALLAGVTPGRAVAILKAEGFLPVREACIEAPQDERLTSLITRANVAAHSDADIEMSVNAEASASWIDELGYKSYEETSQRLRERYSSQRIEQDLLQISNVVVFSSFDNPDFFLHIVGNSVRMIYHPNQGEIGSFEAGNEPPQYRGQPIEVIVPIGALNGAKKVVGVSSNFSHEQGKIGQATLAVMHGYSAENTYFYNTGFGLPPTKIIGDDAVSASPIARPPSRSSLLYTATKTVKQKVEAISSKSPKSEIDNNFSQLTSKSVLDELAKPMPKKDTPPWETEDFVNVYVEMPEFTEKSPPTWASDEIRNDYLLEKQVEGLNKVYEYYSLEKTWGPLNEENLQDYFSSNKSLEKLKNDVINAWGNPITETAKITITPETPGAILWRDLESKQEYDPSRTTFRPSFAGQSKVNFLIYPTPLHFGGDLGNHVVPPSKRPDDVYRIHFKIDKKKLFLGSRRTGAISPSEAVYKARMLYERARGIYNAAEEFFEDPTAALSGHMKKMDDAIDDAQKAMTDKIDSSLRYAKKNKRKTARAAWKYLRKDSEKRRADEKFAKSEAEAAKALEQALKLEFPVDRKYDVRTLKKKIDAVAAKMREYQLELDEWKKPTLNSKNNERFMGGGGDIYPPLDLNLEASNLEQVYSALDTVLSKNGFVIKDKYGARLDINFSKYVPPKATEEEIQAYNANIPKITRIYTTVQGDTYGSIAKAFKSTVREIVTANRNKAPQDLLESTDEIIAATAVNPGEKYNVPTPRAISNPVVKPGSDTDIAHGALIQSTISYYPPTGGGELDTWKASASEDPGKPMEPLDEDATPLEVLERNVDIMEKAINLDVVRQKDRKYLKIYQESYLGKYINATKGISTVSPFNNPRTMAYFMNLNEMYRDITQTGYGRTCDDINTPKALPFIMKYTYPPVGVVPRMPDNYGKPKEGQESLLGSTFESIDNTLQQTELQLLSSVKKSADMITEKAKITQEDKKRVAFAQKGKTHDINDLLPIGELCTWEELWQKTLTKFDFKTLLCEYAACIPEIPWPLDFEWDFDWDFDLPELPTFDLYVIYDTVVAVLAEMLMRLFCAIINKILDMIKFPNCDELFEHIMYGAVSLADEIREHEKEYAPRSLLVEMNPQQPPSYLDQEYLKLIKAKDKDDIAVQAKFIKSLQNSGIPLDRLASDGVKSDTISGMIEDVTRVLVPSEVVGLLRGEATANTISYVSGVVRNAHPALSSYFLNEDRIVSFFSNLGGLVDNSLINKIQNIPANVTAAENTICRETGTTLRDTLLSDGASPEAIRNALDIAKKDAEKRAAAIRELAKRNPLDGNIPKPLDFSDPNAAVSSLPPAFLEQVSQGSRALFDIPKDSFLREISTYEESLRDTKTRSLSKADPEFNTMYRLKAQEAIEILRRFEGVAHLLGSQDLFEVWTAREYLYIQFYYKFVKFTRQSSTIPNPDYISYQATPNEPEFIPNPDANKIKYRDELDMDGNKIPITVERDLPDDFKFDLSMSLEEQERILRNFKDSEGKIDGWFELQESNIIDLSENGDFVVRTRPMPDPDKPSNGPSITAIVSSKTKAPEGEQPHTIAGPGSIRKRNDIQKVINASRLPGGGEAISDFRDKILADVRARLNVLREHLFRDVEVNHKQRTESRIATEQKKMFSRQQEMEREEAVELYGSRAGVMQNFQWSTDAPDEFIMRVPLANDYETKTSDTYNSFLGKSSTLSSGQKTNIKYKEIPGRRPYYSVVVNDGVLLGRNFTHNECDLSIQEEGINTPEDKYIRGWSFATRMYNSLLEHVGKYENIGFPENKMLEFKNFIYKDVYKKAAETFLEDVFDSLSKSPLFDKDDLKEIDSKIRGKVTVNENGCVTLEKGLIDFDTLIEEAIQLVVTEYKKPENSPENIDFLKPGPFEKGLMSALASLLIDVLIIEFALRGGIAFSVYSAEEVLKDKMVFSYLLEFIESSVNKITAVPSMKNSFFEQAMRITGIEREDLALRELIKTRILPEESSLEGVSKKNVPRLIDEVFGTKMTSDASVAFMEGMYATDVARYDKITKFTQFAGIGAIDIEIPFFDDAKRKGKFYLESYVRITGPAANSEFGEETLFSEEFNQHRRQILEDLRIEAQNLGLPRDKIDDVVQRIDERIDELEVMEPVPGAADDNYRTNEGESEELVHIEELQSFIDSSFQDGFTEELADLVGAVYTEDKNDACFLMPKTSYRYPVRHIKRTRHYITAVNTTGRMTYQPGNFTRPFDIMNLFENVFNKEDENGEFTDNSEMRTVRNYSEDSEYFAVPGNYCEIRRDVEEIDRNAVFGDQGLMSSFQNPPSGEEMPFEVQEMLRNQKIISFSSLPIEQYAKKNFILDTIKIDAPKNSNSGKDVVEKLVSSIDFERGTWVDRVDAGNSGNRYQGGYPFAEFDLEDVEPESLEKVERGLGIGKIHIFNDDGEKSEESWHPLDRSAPWFGNDNTDYLNLGQITQNQFVAAISPEEGLLSRTSQIDDLPSASGVHEEWTEYVVTIEGAAFHHPGETFHHPDEMPHLTHFQQAILDLWHRHNHKGDEYGYGTLQEDEIENRRGERLFLSEDNLLLYDLLENTSPYAVENIPHTQAWLDFLNNSSEYKGLAAPFPGYAVGYENVFKKESRMDIGVKSDKRNNHPTKDRIKGNTLARPMGHSPVPHIASTVLKENEYVSPVRVLITRVDYCSTRVDEDGSRMKQILDTELFVNYELPGVYQDKSMPDETGLVRLNVDRKRHLQMGLNKLINPWIERYAFLISRSSETLDGDARAILENVYLEMADTGDATRATGEIALANDEISRIEGLYDGRPVPANSADGDRIRELENTIANARETLSRQRARATTAEEFRRQYEAEPPFTMPSFKSFVRRVTSEDGIIDYMGQWRGPAGTLITESGDIGFSFKHYSETSRQVRPPFMYPAIHGIEDDEPYSFENPILTVSQVYSAGAWMEAWNRGWLNSEEWAHTENFKRRTDEAFISNPGMIVDKSFWTNDDGTLVVPNSHNYHRGEAIVRGALQNAIKMVIKSKNYLKDWVDDRRYESFWGRTSNPHWLWGGPGYWQATRPINRVRSGAFAGTTRHALKYDLYDLYDYMNINPRDTFDVVPFVSEEIYRLHNTRRSQNHIAAFKPRKYPSGIVNLGEPTIEERSRRPLYVLCRDHRNDMSETRTYNGKWIRDRFYHGDLTRSDRGLGALGDIQFNWHRIFRATQKITHSIRCWPDIFWMNDQVPDQNGLAQGNIMALPFEHSYENPTSIEWEMVDNFPKLAFEAPPSPKVKGMVWGDERDTSNLLRNRVQSSYYIEVRKINASSGNVQRSLGASVQQLLNTYPFVVFAKNSLISTLIRGEQRERDFWNVYSSLATPGDNQASGAFEVIRERMMDAMGARMEYLFSSTNYKFGLRMVYILPESSLVGAETLEMFPRKNSLSAREERTWRLQYGRLGEEAQEVYDAVCVPIISVEKDIDFGECGANWRNVVANFREEKNDLLARMMQSPEFINLTKTSFPTHRYVALSTLYSIMTLSTKPELENMLNTTKNNIARVFQLLSERPAFGEVQESMTGSDMRHLVMMHLTPQGPSLPAHLMGNFGDFIQEMAKNALLTPLWIARTMGVNLDPAMKDMDGLVKQCKVKELDWSGIAAFGTETRLEAGVNTDKEYAPVTTAFPADLVMGLLPFPPYVNWQFFKALYKFSNFMIKDKVPSVPPGAGAAGDAGASAAAARSRLAAQAQDRYGTFLGPLGILGLGMPYMPGEEDAFKALNCEKSEQAPPETYPCEGEGSTPAETPES